MNTVEKLYTLADAIKNETSKIEKTKISEDAAIALLGGIIQDSQVSIIETLQERLKDRLSVVKNPFKVIALILKFGQLVEEIKKEWTVLVDQAGNIAQDKNFKSTNPEETFDTAIRKIFISHIEKEGF
ncbi:hypothetical protein [Nostoc phage YongM]|nr:hypothetical protein [Nostoc phage YongM]